MWQLPRDKFYPPTAAQCDDCGGHGFTGCACQGRGWVPAGDPKARRCAREACGRQLPPSQVAVYCSTECAMRDA